MPKQTHSEAGTAGATARGATAKTPSQRPNGPDLGQMAEASQRSLAAFTHLHSRAFRDALKVNAELLDFARRRISADIQTSDRLARCASMSEAVDALNEFYQGAVRDYAEETSALVRLGTTIGSEAARETVEETVAQTAPASRLPSD